jgi:hypothetical protein
VSEADCRNVTRLLRPAKKACKARFAARVTAVRRQPHGGPRIRARAQRRLSRTRGNINVIIYEKLIGPCYIVCLISRRQIVATSSSEEFDRAAFAAGLLQDRSFRFMPLDPLDFSFSRCRRSVAWEKSMIVTSSYASLTDLFSSSSNSSGASKHQRSLICCSRSAMTSS